MRWFEEDPVQDGLNWSLYCTSDPVNMVDPLGLCANKTNNILNWVQTGLDVAGMVPVIGEFADGANAIISLARGDFGGAALSAMAMIPVVGNVTGALKIGKNALKYSDEVIDATKYITKYGDELTEVTTVAGSGQVHHILTNKTMKTLDNHPTLKGKFNREDTVFKYRAADADAHNGYQQWHREVDNKVVDWLQNNPKATEQQFKNFLNNLYQSPDISKRIPNVNIK